MPTANSWTEWRRAAADVGAILALRVRRRRSAAAIAAVVVGALILLSVAQVDELVVRIEQSGLRVEPVSLLPSVLFAGLLLGAGSALATGGGRELLPRDQAVAFPLTPRAESLGALTLAPLNLGWLLQLWSAASITAAARPSSGIGAAGVLAAWLLAATALGQAVGWLGEGVRRGRAGDRWAPWRWRALVAAGAGTLALLVGVGGWSLVLDLAGVSALADVIVSGGWLGCWLAVLVLLLVTAVAVVGGGRAAAWALGRAPREEVRADSRHYPRSVRALSAWAQVRRLDRAGVLRSASLRRGLLLIGVLPTLGLLLTQPEAHTLALVPGLIAAGVGLLFGVNMWCLHGRGGVWVESMPAGPAVWWRARVLLLVELMVVAAGPAVVVGVWSSPPVGIRGWTGLVCGLVVVIGQVVASCAWWSVQRPYAADLRSARATPAPHGAMLGYSARLALGVVFTTVLVGAAVAAAPGWLAVLIVGGLGARVGWRLWRSARWWADPSVRARVIATVSAAG